jgi:hypothetical protein
LDDCGFHLNIPHFHRRTHDRVPVPEKENESVDTTAECNLHRVELHGCWTIFQVTWTLGLKLLEISTQKTTEQEL